jgi:hypothetical protein
MYDFTRNLLKVSRASFPRTPPPLGRKRRKHGIADPRNVDCKCRGYKRTVSKGDWRLRRTELSIFLHRSIIVLNREYCIIVHVCDRANIFELVEFTRIQLSVELIEKTKHVV